MFGERTVCRFALLGQQGHVALIGLIIRLNGSDQTRARRDHTRETHGEFVDGGLAVAVLVRQHLTLFRELDLSEQCAGRLREDGVVCRAATAADGAATAVEQADAHTARLAECDDLLLRTVQQPGRGDDAAVFGRVRVTEHHFLQGAVFVQQAAIDRVIEQFGDHGFDALEIVNGLEQG